MKPITYWEAKLERAQGQLHTLGLLGIGKPRNPPRRKVLRERWRDAMTRWKAADKRYQRHLRAIEKLKARVAYCMSRIEATTPTFWERL